jgi:hypothetical protein
MFLLYPDTRPLTLPGGTVQNIYPTSYLLTTPPGCGWCSKPYYDQTTNMIFQVYAVYSSERRGYANTYEAYAPPGQTPVFGLPASYTNIPWAYRISGYLGGTYYDGSGTDGNMAPVIIVPPGSFPALPAPWSIWSNQWGTWMFATVDETKRVDPVGYGLSRIDPPVLMGDYGNLQRWSQYAEATWERQGWAWSIYQRPYPAGGPLPVPLVANILPSLITLALGGMLFAAASVAPSSGRSPRRRIA